MDEISRPVVMFLNGSAVPTSDPWTTGAMGRVYSPRVRHRISQLARPYPAVVSASELASGAVAAVAKDTEYVFSTWGMPALSAADLGKYLPRLKAVFYAAGSVQGFARPVLERGAKVFSAWGANALPVAEFALAHILLGMRRAPWHSLRLRDVAGPLAWKPVGVIGSYGSTVALISLGMIGRRVVELLKPFDMKVIAYEPYARPGLAEELGVELVSLDDCFRRGDVVSLHAPNLPSTKRMIRREHFAAMKPNATFINSARAAIIDAEGLFDVLRDRPDLTAVIDVADPAEPPPEGSPYYTLPNIVLTPHIAGAMGNETERMAVFMVDEFERLLRGQPACYEVSEKMLETMA